MRAFGSALIFCAVMSWQPAAAQMDDDFAARMEAAQGAAVHPGDDAMACDALQSEINAITQDPQFQAQTAALGLQGQSLQAQAQQQQRGVMASAATGMALGLASGFVPGLGFAQSLMMQHQMAAQRRQGEESQAQMNAMTTNLGVMMPQMMRANHLYELAQGKQCAFIQQSPPAPQ